MSRPTRNLVSPFLLTALVVLAIVIVACGGTKAPIVERSTATPDRSLEDAAERIQVRVGELVLTAELARTPGERARGLGGRPSLPADAGMLFVMDRAAQHAFWMKGMQFALDFIWISAEKRVVDLTEGVPPQPGVPDSELALYSPSAPVLYVLEVNAGVVREHGVRVGDEVKFELP